MLAAFLEREIGARLIDGTYGDGVVWIEGFDFGGGIRKGVFIDGV